jgi:pimeloyl-ACP methyl ester carboxylesterase
MIVKAEADTTAPPSWFTGALAAPVEDRVVKVDGASVADDRHVLAIDLSGHGDSDRRDSYSFDLWSREILAVAKDAGITKPPVVIGHSMGGIVTLQLAALYGARIEGAVVIDSPVREPAPEERAARGDRVFGELRVYPTKEAILSRFRPVPDQPVLGYIADHVAETSIREGGGGWTWKWDPRVFGRGQELLPLSKLDCRVALFRAEHGILSAEMSHVMYDRLGRVAPLIEIPVAGHHVMLDQPIALVAALRTLLSDWDHSLPAQPRDDQPRDDQPRDDQPRDIVP